MSFKKHEVKMEKKRKYSKEWLSQAELSKLFSCEKISFKDLMLMKTLYFGGFRISETLEFRRGDLVKEEGDLGEVANCYLIIGSQKNDKKNREKQPILCELYAQLVMFCKERKIGSHDFIFSSQMRKQMSRQRAFQIVQESAKKAGIDKKITTHTFRRTIIMHLLDQGMQQVDISKFVRHSSIYSIASYVKLSKKKIAEKIRKNLEYV